MVSMFDLLHFNSSLCMDMCLLSYFGWSKTDLVLELKKMA